VRDVARETQIELLSGSEDESSDEKEIGVTHSTLGMGNK